MSWSRTTDGDLINLDHVESLQILMADKEEETVYVWAKTGVDDEGNLEGFALFEGSKADGLAFLDKIASKLPIVRS